MRSSWAVMMCLKMHSLRLHILPHRECTTRCRNNARFFFAVQVMALEDKPSPCCMCQHQLAAIYLVQFARSTTFYPQHICVQNISGISLFYSWLRCRRVWSGRPYAHSYIYICAIHGYSQKI